MRIDVDAFLPARKPAGGKKTATPTKRFTNRQGARQTERFTVRLR